MATARILAPELGSLATVVESLGNDRRLNVGVTAAARGLFQGLTGQRFEPVRGARLVGMAAYDLGVILAEYLDPREDD